MADKQDSTAGENAPDPLESVKLWNAAYLKAATALTGILASPPKLGATKMPDATHIMAALSDTMTAWFANPAKATQTLTDAWQDWTKLYLSALDLQPGTPAIEPERGDRRFNDEEWAGNPAYSYIKQSYLLASKQLRNLVDDNPGEDPSRQAFAKIVVEQYLNAIAPTNFAFTNPQVVRKTVETKGANLISGFANLLSDLHEGRGLVRRRAPDVFKLGENLAATPGGVVYQNDLLQLIQYEPTTAKVRKRPLLYVPPLVNKYYMIDLQPKSSLIRWLVEQGHTVFVVSWVDPDESHRHCELEDYIGRGIIEAMDVITKATGEKAIDLFGFCMGGTLITMAQAVLTARNQQARIGSVTLIGSLVDFTDMKEWSAFVNESQAVALNTHVDKKGYIDKDELQQLFSMMRANDLIWSSYVNHYLLDKEAPPSDLLYWFEDGSHIPQAFLRSYNKKLLLDNHLRVPGAVTLLGEQLDLSQSTNPIMIIALKDDHVSAWTAVYQGVQYIGGPKTFVLGGSGHNAGVINPPSAGKHGYWLNDDLSGNAEGWLAGAEKQEGSWWPFWVEWLHSQKDNGLVAARAVGCGVLPVLEAAPGSNVTKGKS